MRILVFGTGGVGGYFGGILARKGYDVWFVARGAHLRTMKADGLKIRSTGGDWSIPPGTMVEDPTQAAPIDAVLFCVKSYDTEAAAGRLTSLLKTESVVLSLQNGVENEEILQRLLPKGAVLGGVAYVSARIEQPGEIRETGGLQRILLGPMNGPIDRQATELHKALTGAGIKAELRQDIRIDLWRKFAFITSMGSMTAFTRCTQGELMASPEQMNTVFAAMEETRSIAAAKRITLDPVNPEKIIEGLQRFDPTTRSSMYYDMMNGRPMELEALNGCIVRKGQELGIPTPIHQSIYNGLLPHHQRNIADHRIS